MTDEPARRQVAEELQQTWETAPWWVVALFAGGLIALASAYASLARFATDLEWHAHIGDALAPVASFLSLFAVAAALWSVHVQRRELELQRQELRDNRSVMEKQMDQLGRSARAQERLAEAQFIAAEAACRAGMNTAMLRMLEANPDRTEIRTAIDYNGQRLETLTQELPRFRER